MASQNSVTQQDEQMTGHISCCLMLSAIQLRIHEFPKTKNLHSKDGTADGREGSRLLHRDQHGSDLRSPQDPAYIQVLHYQAKVKCVIFHFLINYWESWVTMKMAATLRS